MSYDIVFVRRSSGQSWDEALHEQGGGSGPSPAGPGLTEVEQGQWQRIVRLARDVLGEVGEVDEVDGATPARLVEPAAGIELTFSGRRAAISVAYGHDGDALAVMERVYALARVVEAETGLQGYDMQLGEPVTDAPERLGLDAMRRVATARPDQDDETEGPRRSALSPRPEPGLEMSARDRVAGRPWWRFWERWTRR